MIKTITKVSWLVIIHVVLILALTILFLEQLAIAETQAKTPPVSVPNVVGMSRVDAWGTLTRIGLKPQLAKMVETKVAAQNDKVARQDPGAGARVAEGSIVKLEIYNFVSATVPNVVGMKTNKAQNACTKAGLNFQCGSPVPTKIAAQDSVVISQDPAAGTQVKPKTVVRVKYYIYSIGPQK